MSNGSDHTIALAWSAYRRLFEQPVTRGLRPEHLSVLLEAWRSNEGIIAVKVVPPGLQADTLPKKLREFSRQLEQLSLPERQLKDRFIQEIDAWQKELVDQVLRQSKQVSREGSNPMGANRDLEEWPGSASDILRAGSYGYRLAVWSVVAVRLAILSIVWVLLTWFAPFTVIQFVFAAGGVLIIGVLEFYAALGSLSRFENAERVARELDQEWEDSRG